MIATNNGPAPATADNYWESFSYDAANRLQVFNDNGGGQWSRSFGYDSYGNMWISGSTGANAIAPPVIAPQSQGAFDAATNRFKTSSYPYAAYDAAGNQTLYGGTQGGSTGAGYNLAYDAENRQISVTDTMNGGRGLIATYVYDGVGQRVQKINGSTTTYVYDANGNLAAQYSSGTASAPPCTTCYLSWDHLGSTRMVTDQNGAVVSRHDFLPFGEEIAAGSAGRTNVWGVGDTINQKFTGQERDADTALPLDFFQARYLAGVQGRFLSTDPDQAGADITNPESWNGYGYVLNSPMTYTDPSGMFLSSVPPPDPWAPGGILFQLAWDSRTSQNDPGQKQPSPASSIIINVNPVSYNNCVAGWGAAGAAGGAGAGWFGGGVAGLLGSETGPVDALIAAGAKYLTAAVGTVAGQKGGQLLGSIICSSNAGGGGNGEEVSKEGNGDGGGGAGNLKKLSPSEIKKLKAVGEDPEQIKKDIVEGGGSRYDLFKTDSGEIVVKLKNGAGEAQPIGLNIKNY